MHLAMSWGWGATLPEKQGSAHVFLFPAVDVNLEKDPQARDAVEPVEGAVARPAELLHEHVVRPVQQVHVRVHVRIGRHRVGAGRLTRPSNQQSFEYVVSVFGEVLAYG